MRKSLVFRAASSAAFIPLLFALPARSQQPGSPSPEPSDPKALMFAARTLNNLAASDIKPWHIKATFQLFDGQGAVTDEGTYEEFWASSTQFESTLLGKSFAETEYGSDKGQLRAGARGDVPSLLFDLHRDLTTPLPGEQAIEHASYSGKPVESGPLNLICLTSASPFAAMHCVESVQPRLRISAYPAESIQVLRNRILGFEEHMIPGDLRYVRDGKTVLTAHVDVVEAMNAEDQAKLVPPPDATPAPPRVPVVYISAGVAAGLIQLKTPPKYPVDAQRNGISGTVVLAALIEKDGTIKNLKVVSGAEPLTLAAVDAVRQWRYRPYLLNGVPVPVITTINVVFTLSR